MVASPAASQRSGPATWADTRVCRAHSAVCVLTRSRCFGWRADVLAMSLGHLGDSRGRRGLSRRLAQTSLGAGWPGLGDQGLGTQFARIGALRGSPVKILAHNSSPGPPCLPGPPARALGSLAFAAGHAPRATARGRCRRTGSSLETALACLRDLARGKHPDGCAALGLIPLLAPFKHVGLDGAAGPVSFLRASGGGGRAAWSPRKVQVEASSPGCRRRMISGRWSAEPAGSRAPAWSARPRSGPGPALAPALL